MDIAQELWHKLKSYKIELQALKQFKKASTNSRYYIYKVDDDSTHTAWLITYEAGNQPIITDVLSYYDTSLGSPSNNQQYIFSFSQATAQLTVFSTRPIVSVVGL